MILLALSLLTLGTWQLAGRPTLLGAATVGGGLLVLPSRHLVISVLAGQAVAGLGVALYGVLIAPVAVHDAIGVWLSGALLGVLAECYRSRQR